MTIKAIETRYAGCRFRSRLETRWAVFFDTLGIAWEYEPQGFEVRHGGRWGDPRAYLPDFWLPNERLWVEVKGQMTSDGLGLLVGASYPGTGLPADPQGSELTNDGSERGDQNGPRTLVLGSIPRFDPGRVKFPVGPLFHVLCHNRGSIEIAHATWLLRKIHIALPAYMGRIASDSDEDWRESACDLTSTCFEPSRMYGGRRVAKVVAHSYETARSARFEHGESGTSR